MGYRATDAGKLIALEEAKRKLQGLPSSPPRREQRGLIVQWPGTTAPAVTERKGARPLRRRRRVALLPGWRVPLVVAGVFGILLTALAAARIISGQGAPSETLTSKAIDASVITTDTLSPPVTTDQPLVARVAAQPTSRPVRRISKPIEPSYTIQAGDSLFAIAVRYNTTDDAIQAINNLPDRSVLSVGQRLVIP